MNRTASILSLIAIATFAAIGALADIESEYSAFAEAEQPIPDYMLPELMELCAVDFKGQRSAILEGYPSSLSP